jgi:hypothetical protein
MVKITKLIDFLMVFMHFSIQFWTLTRIRIRNLEFRIRIRQKVPDPFGSGSTTLLKTIHISTETYTVHVFNASVGIYSIN